MTQEQVKNMLKSMTADQKTQLIETGIKTGKLPSKYVTNDITNLITDLLNNMEKDKESAISESNKDILDGQVGHSRLFIDCYNDKLKIINNGECYYYNYMSSLWEKRDISYMLTLVSQCLTDVLTEIRAHKNYNKLTGDIVKKLDKISSQCNGVSHCEGVCKMSKAALLDTNFISTLNRTKHLLPIKNKKVIDLKTLKVRDRIQSDLFSFELKCEYLPKSQLTHAKQFFKSISNNDDGVMTYLQNVLGYCMTGEVDQRCIYLFWGVGSNGKTVLIELMKDILGNFYMTADKHMFIETKDMSSHTSFMVPLKDARLAVFSESKKKERLDMEIIKKLTGNDTISAREIYGKQFEFKPQSKYIFLTNNLPWFNPDELSEIDRIRGTPFLARFTNNPTGDEVKKDNLFIENLRTKYLDEVFTFICQGACEYYKYSAKNESIPMPTVVLKALEAYRIELDTVVSFTESKCNKTNPKKYIHRSVFYDYYVKWCKDENRLILSKSDCFKKLTSLKYEFVKHNGNVAIKGLQFNDIDEME